MKRWVLVVAVVAFLGILAAGGAWWRRQRHVSTFARTPFGSPSTKPVVVASGAGPRGLSTQLAEAAVVASADDFYAFIREEHAASKLKAGEYEFRGPLTPEQVLERLEKGEVKTYRFTVPEGLRVDETLDILARSELRLDREKLSKLASSQPFLKKLGIPTDRIEGFLYPDTYLFARGADEEAVLAKMVSRTFEELHIAEAHRKAGIELDTLQAITAASIIEKETGAAEERPRVSCVLNNRLRLRMRLGMDPTVLYAMMLIRGRYVNNLTLQDLRTPHPYNTYTNFGLPPGPIANPGAAAIEAALDPIDCHDLYYVSRNDGTHQFCPDLKCHNAAVARWQKRAAPVKKRARTKTQ